MDVISQPIWAAYQVLNGSWMIITSLVAGMAIIIPIVFIKRKTRGPNVGAFLVFALVASAGTFWHIWSWIHYSRTNLFISAGLIVFAALIISVVIRDKKQDAMQAWLDQQRNGTYS